MILATAGLASRVPAIEAGGHAAELVGGLIAYCPVHPEKRVVDRTKNFNYALSLMKSDSDNYPCLTIGLLVGSLVTIGSGSLLVVFAGLRENQTFWTQVGNFPLWLRDLVFWSFMPMFLGTVGLLCGLSIAHIINTKGKLRLFVMESILILLGWGLVTTAAYIAFDNNVRNIINGAPLHRH